MFLLQPVEVADGVANGYGFYLRDCTEDFDVFHYKFDYTLVVPCSIFASDKRFWEATVNWRVRGFVSGQSLGL
jgi:hypothetical protein